MDAHAAAVHPGVGRGNTPAATPLTPPDNAVATAGTSEEENEETCANSGDKQSRTQSRRVVVLNVGRGGSVNGFTGGVPLPPPHEGVSVRTPARSLLLPT